MLLLSSLNTTLEIRVGPPSLEVLDWGLRPLRPQPISSDRLHHSAQPCMRWNLRTTNCLHHLERLRQPPDMAAFN